MRNNILRLLLLNFRLDCRIIAMFSRHRQLQLPLLGRKSLREYLLIFLVQSDCAEVPNEPHLNVSLRPYRSLGKLQIN